MADIQVDVWKSLTLGEVFPNIGARAGKLKAETEKLISEVDTVLEEFNKRSQAAQQMLENASSVQSQISASGFYMLPMEPGVGTIQSRITGAENPPPVGQNPLTCGVVIMFQGVDFESVNERYQSLMKIITSPI